MDDMTAQTLYTDGGLLIANYLRMVNNAGLGAEGILIHELEEETWDKMMQVISSGTQLKYYADCAIVYTAKSICEVYTSGANTPAPNS